MRFWNIGFFDLSTFAAAYVAKHRRGLIESENSHHQKVRYLDLVNDREAAPLLAGWKSAGALLHKVAAMTAALPRPAELINATAVAFDPGGHEQWHEDDVIDPDCFMRVHILLQPAPAFRLYAGDEMLAPPPWHAIAVDHRVPLAQSNFHPTVPAHQLVLELALDVAG